MNTLSIGQMAVQVLPGLSPWIIPMIAVAAKRTHDDARQTLRGRPPVERPAFGSHGARAHASGPCGEGVAAKGSESPATTPSVS
jgi:hypothetical protein